MRLRTPHVAHEIGALHSLAALLCACVLGLPGCGGSGHGSTPPNPVPPTPQPAALTGTASAGSAWALANVSVTDSSGEAACVESSIATSAVGAYTCTLAATATEPFFVVVEDPQGASAPLVSVLAATPAAASTAVLNATPLTTAIAARLASDLNPLTLVNGHEVDASALQTLTQNVVSQLANVLGALGLSNGFSPFSTPIVAATATSTGNAADQLLDLVHVTTDLATSAPAFTTADNPIPVALATANSPGIALGAPASSTLLLPNAAQIEAEAISTCFALPLAQRVLATDTTIAAQNGGSAVTSMAPECASIGTTSATVPSVDFRERGFSLGQYFYTLLTSTAMTGATFSVPEITAFYSAATTSSGRDEAVLNFKYIDAAGYPGNIIATARYVPGSATAAHTSDWWLTGNQEAVDVDIKTLIRKTEQLNPTSSFFSHFQSGLQFQVDAKGPGSISSAGSMSYARVTGPGLPTAGLVLVAPVAAEVGQPTMDVLNQTGVVSGATTCFNCPNYWLNFTAGISGAAASTLTSQFAGLTTAPIDTDTSGIVKGAHYQVELFYGSQTSASVVLTKTLLTSMAPATQGISLAWNSMGTVTQAALDPGNAALNGAQSSITVDWLQNPSAQQIRSVNVTVSTNGTYAVSQAVPRGVLSIVETPTPAVPALTTNTTRAFLLHYRTLDNTDKNSEFRWN